MAWDTERDQCPLTGCPGPDAYPSVPAVADDDDEDREETELDYLPGEWGEIGYADGSMGSPCRPPEEDSRRQSYHDGWAAGRLEWVKVRDADRPKPPTYDDGSEIPF